MVVVQTTAPTADQTPRSALKKWRPDRRIVFAVGVCMLIVAGAWLMGGRSPNDGATTSAVNQRLSQLKRAATQAASGDADAALREIESLTDADCTAEELLTAASAFAVASARPTSDRALSEHRAARAVLFLRRAFAQGLMDANSLRTNPALAPLQKRNDFRQLMIEMTPR
jgi:hypothetical protein